MKRIMKKLSSFFLGLAIVIMLSTGFAESLVVQATNNVKPSTEEYTVELFGRGSFVCNEKAVDVNAGECVYLTYTVDSVYKDTTTQSGVLATQDHMATTPYEVGIMKYNNSQSLLLRPGYTYFVKFEVTEFGFDYVVAYSNGKHEGYETGFSNVIGEVEDKMKFCGIWMTNGELSATLTHVRCYDKNGNDLGVKVKGGMLSDPSFVANSNATHSYEFDVKDKITLAISNLRYTKSDTVFLEYEIKNIKENMKQTGAILTNNPTAAYPYLTGGMYLDNQSTGEMTKVGVKYLVRFKKTEKGFQVTAKYTKNGRDTYVGFPEQFGKFDTSCGYVAMWFATGTMSGRFVNVKCYDAEGKNLGIQTNHSDIEVLHSGGLEDYSVCEGAYYCEENQVVITLDAQRNMAKYIWGKNDVEKGEYTIQKQELTMKNSSGENSKYIYAYNHIIDKDNNRYARLKEYEVRFVTGSEEIVESINLEDGYKLSKPEDPEMTGNRFKGWYFSNGIEYDFDSIVKESITLYAKWMDGDGNEYLATDLDIASPKVNVIPIVVICICLVMVAATVAGVVWIVKKGKRYENTK